MDIIRYAIEKPITVAVGVILVVLFGTIGLMQLPRQLTPDVETPEITVRTVWAGATPTEIEQEIIEKQEEALKGLENLESMESSAFNNYGQVSLTFPVGSDLDAALLRVSNKMNEVADYPENVEKPAIEAAGAQSNPVIWIMFKTRPENTRSIATYRTYFEDELRQHLERVKGVGSLFVGGGTETEVHIEIDPQKLARYNLTIDQVISRVRGANRNTSAGLMGIGKKDYRIRTVSQFETPEDALSTVIYDDGLQRVHLRDVADTGFGYERLTGAVMQNGTEVIAIGVRKEQGANVIELVDRLQKEIDRINEEMLAPRELFLDWVYDEAPYILNAIDLVKKNVMIGGALAIIVLLIFLRSASATITTAVAIPISVVGTFLFLWVLDRNLNVVSLAGISFAVGMLVDNAIVVLENIDRHRHMGKKAFAAAYEGASEVWGAVFASTATTVAVFVPVIFIQEEAGQLFRDIAIAITFSILLSLFVSVAVIPTILNRLYRLPRKNNTRKSAGIIDRIGNRLHGGLMALSGFFLKNVVTRLGCVLLFTALSVAIVWQLMPKTEYLPQGNQNLVLAILIPTPGSSVDKRQEMGEFFSDQLAPYLAEDWKDGIPQIEDIWFVAEEGFNLLGGVSVHDTEAGKLLPLYNRIANSLPDVFGFAFQAGIFQTDIASSRTIDVDITGEDMTQIIGAGGQLFGALMGGIPGSQIRPIPSLETTYPEARLIPDREKLAASGLTEAAFGTWVDVLMDGRKIDDFRPEGKRQLDLVVKGPQERSATPEALLNTAVVNPFGTPIRIGDVADLVYTRGMTQVNHLERKRHVRLQVTPPESLPLQAAMETIENKVVRPMQEAGQLPGVEITLGGNADKLTQTREALQWNFLLAVVITYLLMSALFENFFYPFIIMFTVPLAGAGGFIGLRLVDAYVAPQGFDVVTMLGFIILVGTVVNNAILIVHQSLNNVRYGGYTGTAAITESVRTRIRPIFMSAATSVFGMLPLAISTGAGSELYRGLGSVLLGGLALSTMFTLFVVPSLLAFFIGFEKKRKKNPNGTPLAS
ncbi:MAG: efflux RND transporter permease subunit [Desulfobacterales bacterium]|nr:efflux RND transporter permease subunit [Desulfobacterales bacterium]